ncbi:MAG: transporter [Lachnospiraceae bacterium]|nr:transporter [Lachnospiraceae bacterium]
MKQYVKGKASKVQGFIFSTAMLLELLVALIVIIALIIMLINVPRELLTLIETMEFNNFLKNMFDIIIGIELLKMLCRHDLDSVVEVLLFSVAREMVIEHMPIYFTLIGIISISVLFLIRKYLFVSALDKDEH